MCDFYAWLQTWARLPVRNLTLALPDYAACLASAFGCPVRLCVGMDADVRSCWHSVVGALHCTQACGDACAHPLAGVNYPMVAEANQFGVLWVDGQPAVAAECVEVLVSLASQACGAAYELHYHHAMVAAVIENLHGSAVAVCVVRGDQDMRFVSVSIETYANTGLLEHIDSRAHANIRALIAARAEIHETVGGVRSAYLYLSLLPVFSTDGVLTHYAGYIMPMHTSIPDRQLVMHLHDVIDAVGVGLTITDARGIIVHANQAEAELHGYTSPLELIGQPARMFAPPGSAVDPPDRTAAVYSRQSWNVHRSGLVFPVQLTSSTLYDSQQRLLGRVTICTNTSDRQDIERRLRLRNDELQEVMRTLAHDLMNPANWIAEFTEMLAQDYRGVLDADGVQICELLNAQAIQMTKIIEAVRLYMQTGVSLNMQALDAAQPILDALALANGPLRQEALITIQECAERIQVDRTQMTSVFFNLFVNSLKFRSPARPLRIDITMQRLPAQHVLEYTYRDNGIGIAASNLSKVTRLFYRVDPDIEGLGVGLAHIRKIIEQHGGDFQITSKLDAWTCVRLTVPLAGSALVAAEAEP